ncbi:hypothetical protein JOD45_000641 [Scopulibacillus daqui]|uniref:DUF3953 domain-containing protein n=1 Tax=Scopulibacillus daqui TaxID=1469162 RepID=A0ABS2PWM9_9BACL|nr:hypothetical protein [Scopulibacillus daqui]
MMFRNKEKFKFRNLLLSVMGIAVLIFISTNFPQYKSFINLLFGFLLFFILSTVAFSKSRERFGIIALILAFFILSVLIIRIIF